MFSNLPLFMEKLDGSNYSAQASDITLWFSGLGHKSHFTTSAESIPEAELAQSKNIDCQLCSVIRSILHFSLKPISRPYNTYESVWSEARALYTIDAQRLYGVRRDLMTLLAP